MSKNFKIFLITFILSLPFWWGANVMGKNLTNFFFWREFAKNPQLLSAQAAQMAFEQNLRDLKPVRDSRVPNVAIEAQSFTSVFLDKDGQEKILLAKNSQEPLPIASLGKLMTALVVLENYDLAKKITISKEAVEQEENFGKLIVGSTLTVEQLLYPLLMESSNDAAFALANDYPGMNEKKFVALMNQAAQKLNLKNTYFFNSTGLDPEDEKSEELNRSSANDLVILVRALLKQPLVWEILTTPTYTLLGQKLENTNKLLTEDQGILTKIVGGKTGYTEKALSCFLLVVEAPKSKGYLINVILGTENNRFEEMRKLVEWDYEAFYW
jgi:D-alanyl-D-alanine carboxypeptidase (penicillin-binding protein 5/6)